MKVGYISLIFGLLLFEAKPVAALTDDQVRDVSRSVVQIICDLSGGRSHTGSGFVYNDSTHVVTSFHVVAVALASDARLHIYSSAVQLDRPAKVVRVLRSSDLALLELNRSLGVPALESNDSVPSFGDQLVAFGHPVLTPTVRRQILWFDKEEALKNITPDNASQMISRIGMPDLDGLVLGLMGPLMPGHSGAPILDGTARVVAIGDGGLEKGAASISWAIPAKELDRLLSSRDRLTADSQVVSDLGVLFAAELNPNINANQASTRPVTAGPVVLRKIRVRTLGEMRRSLAAASDDPLGFLQLLQPLLVPGIQYDPDTLTFDIYQGEESGMNVVIPSGIALRAGDNKLTAQSQDGNIRWLVSPVKVGSDTEAQQASVEFERQIVAMDPSVIWQGDPAWSYPTLRQTLDGILIMRKRFTGYVGFVPSKVCFETFAKRGDYLLSAAVIRSGTDLPGSLPQNDPVWASAILGIHLSSFSK